MMKNWKVGTKLFAILVLPILALVALTIYGVRDRLEQSNQAARVAELITFAEASQDLATQLQLEGVLSASYTASRSQTSGAEMREQRERTDAAVERYESAVATVDPGRQGGDVPQQLRSAEQRISALSTLRRSIDEAQSEPTSPMESFRQSSNALVGVISAISESIVQPELARLFQNFAAAQSASTAIADQAMWATALAQVGFFPQNSNWPKGSETGAQVSEGQPCTSLETNCTAASDFLEKEQNVRIAEEVFEGGASVANKPLLRDSRAGTRFADTVKALTAAINTGDIEFGAAGEDGRVDPNLEPATALARSLDEVRAYRTVEDQILAQTQALADRIQEEANRESTLFLVLAALAIFIAVAGAYVVARAITRPLKELTGAAYSLSTEKLPALVERLRNPEATEGVTLRDTLTPIEVDSKDEIGQLAEAFNSIQQVTIEVAEEQSVLLRKGIGDIFINLARRNQTLLDRQIEFIDQLEANEEDPDQLDNLFKLDHLATRMRRNAESLLVLAGAEPPRRRGRPVALADVVRVAIGEVEDFARIQLLALDEAVVGGNVAVDLAHLLSELMENATHFSPPDTMVEVVGHAGERGTYVISVSDQGIGMSADQLAEANHQLAHPPLVGLALSRSLGFIVVGRLAQRFGIEVKLTASPAGGVAALVTLPADVVTIEGQEAPPEAAEESEPEAVAVDVDVIELSDAAADVDVDVAEAELDETSTEPTLELGGDDLLEDLLDESVELELPTDEEFDRGIQTLVEEETAAGEPEAEAEAVSVAEREPALEEVLAEPEAVEPEPTAGPQRVSPPGETTAERIAHAARAEAKSAGLTAAGLVQRTPKKRAASAIGGGPIGAPVRTTGQSQWSPEEVRKMLSRYRSGLNRGRSGANQDQNNS